MSYNPRKDVVICRSAILPTLGHRDYLFHPATRDVYTEIVDRVIPNASGCIPDRLLYVTRSAFASSTKSRTVRQVKNHLDVEKLVRSFGFETVAPETMSWREQIATFARARVVVGEHGSALKNLLFAPAGAAAVVLNILNNTQASIAALRNQHYFCVPTLGFDPANHATPYEVDLARLEVVLRHALRCTASNG